ncbi:MAG: CopD family protein [Pseudomonadota bacterium]
MSFSITITLHILATIIWVGGMFFAHFILRPSAMEILEPPLRLTLWVSVFKRFFLWVWIASIALPITGYWMIFGIFGGMANTGVYIHIMSLNGLIMLAIYSYIYFKPFQALQQAVAEKDYPLGGKHINSIRILVTINLFLGLFTAIVASGGKYWGI